MRKQKKGVITTKLFILFFCVALGTLSIVSRAQANDPNDEGDTYIDINQDTTWHAADNLDFRKTVYVNPGATLTIEKGAQIKFEKDINGGDTDLYVGGGRLVADGTQEEPIKITASSDQEYSVVEFYRQDWEGVPILPASFLRYVEIYGAGYAYDDGSSGDEAFLNKIISSAYADFDGSPAVFYGGGKVHMENCTFHDNEYADVGVLYNEFSSSTGTDNYLEIINSNFEKNGDAYALRSEVWCKQAGEACQRKIFFKDDWFGDQSGPN